MDLVASIVARFHPLLRLSCRSNNIFGRRYTPAETGKRGEKTASLWLQSRGCRILRRNYKADGGGEVDVIYREEDTLVFCEVKTRTRLDFGPPSRAVNRKKRILIRKGAHSWMKRLKKKVPFRFDIMEVVLQEGTPPHIHRIMHAFPDTE